MTTQRLPVLPHPPALATLGDADGAASAGVPDLLRVHVFPCRFGNVVPHGRDTKWNGHPVPGSPFGWSDGVEWVSDAVTETRRGLYPASSQGTISRMALWRHGGSTSGRLLLVADDMLEEAVQQAEYHLITSPGPRQGLREWSLGYAWTPTERWLGINVRFVGDGAEESFAGFVEAADVQWIVDFTTEYPNGTTNGRYDRCTILHVDEPVGRDWADGRIVLADATTVCWADPVLREIVGTYCGHARP